MPHCSHSRAPIVHTAVHRENNEHGCVYLRCRAVCKLPGCVEGYPWYFLDIDLQLYTSLTINACRIYIRMWCLGYPREILPAYQQLALNPLSKYHTYRNPNKSYSKTATNHCSIPDPAGFGLVQTGLSGKIPVQPRWGGKLVPQRTKFLLTQDTCEQRAVPVVNKTAYRKLSAELEASISDFPVSSLLPRRLNFEYCKFRLVWPQWLQRIFIQWGRVFSNTSPCR